MVAGLARRGAFRDAREVLYHGQKARQGVAEAPVVLDRPSKHHHGRVSQPGKALRLRLVVAQVRDDAERNRRSQRAAGPVRTVAEAVRVVAQRGGYLGRKGDGPPGLKVLWRGLKALHHMVLGFRHESSASRSSVNYR